MSFVHQQDMSVIDQKTRVLEGVLKKKSPKGFMAKMWQSRYFVLYDDVLQYYKNRGDAAPVGMIPLQLVTAVNQLHDKKKGCRFDIVVGDAGSPSSRTFSLLTDTDADCDLWVQRLTELVDDFQSEQKEELQIDTRGKFWKNTVEIRDARARGNGGWGGQRYLLDDGPSTLGRPSDAVGGGAAMSRSATGSTVRSSIAPPLPAREPLAQFVVQRKLADGPFGHVYTVVERKTELNYLMYVYRKADAGADLARDLVRRMARFDHPYVFAQVHSGETSDAFFAVYEFAVDQSLFVHLQAHRRMPEAVVRHFAAEVALALEYLHEQGSLFLNLGPEKIFLDEDGHASVSDFLLCLTRDEMPPELGTPEYMTPERVAGEEERETSDWWRLGVLLYELMVGIPPFRARESDVAELSAKISGHTAETLRFPPFVSPDGVDLVQRLLRVAPGERLGAGGVAEIKRHAFFKDTDWVAAKQRRQESPEWVDEFLQDSRRSGGRPTPGSREYVLEVTVRSARELPGLKADGSGVSNPYCVLVCEQQTSETPVRADTCDPQWGHEAQFEIATAAAGQLTVKVFHQEGEAEKPIRIGLINVPLAQLRAERHVDEEFSIIGADCLAHGFVRLDLRWQPKLGRRVIEPPTDRPSLSFATLFGVQDRAELSLWGEDEIPPPAGAPPPPPPDDGSGEAPPPPPPPVPPRPSMDQLGVPGRLSHSASSQSAASSASSSSASAAQGPGRLSTAAAVFLRGKVSKKKRRYVDKEAGFDLDLSYVTDRLVAMGFPAEGKQSVYRNPMEEVQRFFSLRHAGGYKVYNLCAERGMSYPATRFEKTARFPFPDHNAPTLQLVMDFCRDVHAYLDLRDDYVAAVHCKAGKGRTGVMICSYLVYAGTHTADEAIALFAQRRTHNSKGITIPSQQRYVRYFERVMRDHERPAGGLPFSYAGAPLRLARVVIHTVPNFDFGGGCDPFFVVRNSSGRVVYDHRRHAAVPSYRRGPSQTLECSVPLRGDVKLVFYDQDKVGRDDKMWWLWLHTSLVPDRLELARDQLDGAVKDTKLKHFDAAFRVELFFERGAEGAPAPDADLDDGVGDFFAGFDDDHEPDEDDDDEDDEEE